MVSITYELKAMVLNRDIVPTVATISERVKWPEGSTLDTGSRVANEYRVPDLVRGKLSKLSGVVNLPCPGSNQRARRYWNPSVESSCSPRKVKSFAVLPVLPITFPKAS